MYKFNRSSFSLLNVRISKNTNKDIRNYYFFNKTFVKNFLGVSILFGTIYFLNKNYHFKKIIFLDPIDDILNSQEVKGTGINLLENLFKDKRTKLNVLVALKSVIKEKEFETEFKVFIKAWLFKVIKDREFLQQTKKTVIELVKSKPFLDETANLLKFISNEKETRDIVIIFFKELALREDVFEKMCNLFENCSIKAITSDRNKTGAMNFCNELMSDNEFRTKLFTKALKVFSSASDTPPEYKNKL
jgi:hypothetical protein